jgi:hypothetical protein
VIARILHEGQYELPPSALTDLRRLDDELMERLTAGDEQGFAQRRDALLALVRAEGRMLPAEVLRESDLVLPPADITLAEARAYFTQHA